MNTIIERKSKLLLFIIMSLAISANAQILTPVHWSYGVKKLDAVTYEIHLRAKLDDSWHIYSQTQPDNAVALPTKIIFKSNSDIEIIGIPKELGQLVKYYNKAVDIGANQYSGMVDFVQIVKIKDNSVKNISGIVGFQTCTDQKCLPPDKFEFSIPIK